MRERPTGRIERGRILTGPFASDFTLRCNGMFEVPGPCGQMLRIVASDGNNEVAWEHVSVSRAPRRGQPGPPPNWEEMSWIKDQFWKPEECVVQFHPPASEYVNFHPGTLHLWRSIGLQIPRPPTYLVGPK